ncbi:MAG TPA: hypothetical protein VMV09_09705 [Candidatus Saccharimonadales bacterium]|nr:hypothetical protein [Candidatus Saccharimonadales bacterium]
MAKLLYVEPSDEITDLIDRIRRSGSDRDLVFVVPPDGHVLRTPLDMRLLMQYTRGFQKRIAVVSGDPQIQTLAIRTGFPTFASLARLEQGAPLRGVPDPTAAAAAGPVAAAAATGAVAATKGAGKPAAESRGVTRANASAVAAGGAAVVAGSVAGWWARLRGWWGGQSGNGLKYGVVGAVVAVLLIVLLFILPSATVTVGVRAHKLVDTATIQGNDGSQSGPTLDQISTQALQTGNFSQNFTITPSGTQALPPVPATGTLQLCGTPKPHGPGIPPPWTLTFSGSPSFQDSPSIVFTTTSSSENGTYTVPACSAGTVGIPAQATASTVGTQGNLSAGQSWSWDGSGGQLDGSNNASQIPWTLTNPAAMTGGANATTQSVFAPSDVAAAQTQQQTIDTALTQKANKQLRHLASQDKGVLAQNSAGTGIDVTVTNPTLPTGCNTSASTPCPAGAAQTLTVTVTAAGTSYSRAAARAAVLQDLKSKLPTGAELLADPKIGKMVVVSAGAGGSVTLTSRSIGYWAPKLDLAPFRSKLVFMGPGAAKTYLLAQLPGASTVAVKQSPYGLPWLPLFSGNIHMVRVSLAEAHTAG